MYTLLGEQKSIRQPHLSHVGAYHSIACAKSVCPSPNLHFFVFGRIFCRLVLLLAEIFFEGLFPFSKCVRRSRLTSERASEERRTRRARKSEVRWEVSKNELRARWKILKLPTFDVVSTPPLTHLLRTESDCPTYTRRLERAKRILSF
jgi:hypothetical protein